MKTDTINKLNDKIRSLNFHEALTFGYLICKKLFPDYATFSEYEDFGKPDVLYSSLIALRKSISGEENSEQIERLINVLWDDEDITPDTDDFPGNLSASLALNTVSALYHCLKYASTQNTDYVLKVSKLSLESVISYFVVSNDIDQNQPKDKYNETLNNSVFILSEIQLQLNLIDKIQTFDKKNTKIYTKIKTNDSKLVENSLYSQFVYA